MSTDFCFKYVHFVSGNTFTESETLQLDDEAAGNSMFSTADVQDAKFNSAYVGLLGMLKPVHGLFLSSYAMDRGMPLPKCGRIVVTMWYRQPHTG